ncbi:GAF domain-containing protein [Marispirochaeta sp.]|jgi:GAF domain-containing protein|uniref:GAF domain-containing protein n=1 Tax=Marispirochaeta sp. TaxID=2038653 RepID=UPI0029C90B41|nr:GAF domain-containing protein [Marispirochaeta sp.]
MAKLSGLNSGAIYFLEEDFLILRATTPALEGDPPEKFIRARLQEHPHINDAVHNHKAVYIRDTESEPLTDEERSIAEARQLKSILFVPLLSQERTIGVFITGGTSRHVTLKKAAILLCETLANIAALAAANALHTSKNTD